MEADGVSRTPQTEFEIPKSLGRTVIQTADSGKSFKLMIRVRFHGRGGQGAKTASRILGTAAFNEGLNVQDSPLYGSERRGAPVAAFTRISDGDILERGFIFEPDVVVVIDDTLLKDRVAKPLEGLRSGGVLYVNAAKEQADMKGGRDDIKLVTTDLTTHVVESLGRPLLSAVSACVAARLVSVISEETILAAVAAELRDNGVKEDRIAKNLELAKWAFHSVEPQKIETRETPTTLKRSLVPMEIVLANEGMEDVVSMGNSRLKKTGNWRISRPIINYEKCTTCMVCFAYCPDSAITLGEDKKLTIDYENCKGCLICYTECPPKAITIEREVKAA
jgi:pyruvate ferredoxin oxidoreductase gamma subunit